MKLTVKTLKNDKFTVEVDPSTTIADARKIVADARDLVVSTVKLIHAGKILKDSITVAECNMTETDFVVVMGKKKDKAAAAAQPAQAEAPPAATGTTTTEETPTGTTTTTTTTTTSTTPATTQETQPTSQEAPSAGTADQVAALTSMGFPEADAQAALRAAFGNQDRAVEYLTNPSTAPPSMRSGGASSGTTGTTPATAPAATEGAEGGGSADGPRTLAPDSPLAQFLDNPHFTSLRAAVQQRPMLLPTLLQEIAGRFPEMVELFNQNREDFYILLNMPLEGAGGGGTPRGPRGEQMIQVTQEENEAIERLCALGFDKNEVIQAYFACDKNEQLAANLLLSSQQE